MRRQRFDRLMRILEPSAPEKVLDVGVSEASHGGGNFFLRWYPWPGNLTACGIEGEPELCRQRGLRYVNADARELPFADKQFDIAHCNAVVEHAGSRGDQRRLVVELLRVAKRLWLATPDAESPFEMHTLVPFVHWLSRGPMQAVYRFLGHDYFADPANLNLLTEGELRKLFPVELRAHLRIHKQRFMGLPAVITVFLDQRDSQ